MKLLKQYTGDYVAELEALEALEALEDLVPLKELEALENLDEYAYYYSCKAEQVAQGKATFTPMELMYERLFKELDEHALDDDLPDIDSDHRPNNAA